MNAQNNAGFSFGLKHSMESEFKEFRRKQNLNIKKSLENVFDLENITVGKSQIIKKNQRSNSTKSIRELLIEKRENSKLIRIAKREKKLNRIKNRQENLSLEKEKKNEAIKAKYQIDIGNSYKSLSRSKMPKSVKFGITSDNYSDDEFDEKNNLMVEESYLSEHGEELDKRKKFLNDRYNIEANKRRYVSQKKIEPDITPGPGNSLISLFLIFIFILQPLISIYNSIF